MQWNLGKSKHTRLAYQISDLSRHFSIHFLLSCQAVKYYRPIYMYWLLLSIWFQSLALTLHSIWGCPTNQVEMEEEPPPRHIQTLPPSLFKPFLHPFIQAVPISFYDPRFNSGTFSQTDHFIFNFHKLITLYLTQTFQRLFTFSSSQYGQTTSLYFFSPIPPLHTPMP